MDRNLTERLKKLSQELAATQNAVKHHPPHDDTGELEELQARIEDLQDEIWDIEDILREEAENEYGENSAKGWN